MSLIERIKSWVRSGLKKEKPLISVVLLLRDPFRLADDCIHEAITNAWGRHIRGQSNEYVVNKPPICFIRFGDLILMINNAAKPYVSEEYRQQRASKEFKELTQLKVVLEHRAFLTVDLMHPQDPSRKAKQSAYRKVCALAAEFVDDNCLGVTFPETGHLSPYDADLKNALRSDHPLEEISHWSEVPVITISEDDPKLRAAVSEARSRWPEFVSAFRERRTDQLFSVKAPFRDGENVEWMWVTLSDIGNSTVEGNLGNAPVDLTNLRAGDHVRVPASVIADWIYTDGQNVVGGFSLEALRQGRRS